MLSDIERRYIEMSLLEGKLVGLKVVPTETFRFKTFRDRLMYEHPEKLDVEAYGGCLGCPNDYGYEKSDRCPNIEKWFDLDEKCRKCWDRKCELET